MDGAIQALPRMRLPLPLVAPACSTGHIDIDLSLFKLCFSGSRAIELELTHDQLSRLFQQR